MPITISKAIKIMDSHNRCIGIIETPNICGKLVSGTFASTQHFEKYKNIFLDLEQAANNLLLIHADQLEKKIQKLAFYASTSNSRRIHIKDLQIMEDQVSFNIDCREEIEDF